MSFSTKSETYKEHSYWYRHGDRTPWLDIGDGVITTYNGVIATASTDDAQFGEGGLNADATIEALSTNLTAFVKPPNGTVALLFRFSSQSAEGTADVLQLLAASGVDVYTKVAQLSITAGAQIQTTNAGITVYFADTIVEANNDWITDTAVIQPSTPDDDIAMYVLNTHGFDRFLFLATTKNSSVIHIDWKII